MSYDRPKHHGSREVGSHDVYLGVAVDRCLGSQLCEHVVGKPMLIERGISEVHIPDVTNTQAGHERITSSVAGERRRNPTVSGTPWANVAVFTRSISALSP